MITDLALAALGAGSVEIVGPEAGFVRVNAAYSWGAPNPEPARQQTTSEWMRPTGSTASSEPQRVVPAMELAAQRWQR